MTQISALGDSGCHRFDDGAILGTMGNLPSSIGPYQIVRQLGEGGMGAVFEAVHTAIERRVAIKVLKPEYTNNHELVARFFNEARAVNRVEHPSLVQVSDYGQTPDGTVYLVMEFLRGGMLRTRLDQFYEAGKRIPSEQMLQITWQVAEALVATHAKGIVHRDLKPENIMIVSDPAVSGGERAKILDFGIAKLHAASQVMTAPSRLMGTPRYMSPEQCRGATDIDGRTDVYALGILLYEMLAGQPPFGGDSLEGILAQHLFKAAEPVSALAPHVAPELAELVQRMLAKDRAQRPTMAEVEAALRRALHQSSRAHQSSAPATVPVPQVRALPASAAPANLNTTLRHSLGQRVLPMGRWRWFGAALATVVTSGVIVSVWSRYEPHPPQPSKPSPQQRTLAAPPAPASTTAAKSEVVSASAPLPDSSKIVEPATPKPELATEPVARPKERKASPSSTKPVIQNNTSAQPTPARTVPATPQPLEKKPAKQAPPRRNMYDGIL